MNENEPKPLVPWIKEMANFNLKEKYDRDVFTALTKLLKLNKLDMENLRKILSEEEIKILTNYTDAEGVPNVFEINRKTRNGEKLTSEEQTYFDIINKILNCFSMPIDVLLYRSFSISDLSQCDMFDENGKPKIGSVLSFKSLTSTSFNILSSLDYLKINKCKFNIFCKINCKKGSKGLCLLELSKKKSDYEFLIPYGTKYRINNAVKKENNFTFEIEII